MKQLVIMLVFSLVAQITIAGGAHPHYGGGHHTSSHGGTYKGTNKSSHKGGHYANSKTHNTYGTHK
jgi:hypothetical protein